MKLKLDENLSRHLKPALNALGYDTSTAADEELLSRPNVEVAACAAQEGRILLTLDVEFADLRKYPPGTHPEIILFRPMFLGPLSSNRKVYASGALSRNGEVFCPCGLANSGVARYA